MSDTEQQDVGRARRPVVRTTPRVGVALALCAAALAIPAGAPAQSGGDDRAPELVGVPVAGGGLVFTLRVTGTYRARPCAGRMLLTYRADGLRTVRRLTRLSSSCHYQRRIVLRVRSAARLPTTLRVHQRFTGNRSSPARRAKTVSARLVAPRG